MLSNFWIRLSLTPQRTSLTRLPSHLDVSASLKPRGCLPSASRCCSHPLSLLSLHHSFPNLNQVGSARLSTLLLLHFPSFLSSSHVPLSFLCKGLVQHLASPIKTLCTFRSNFQTFLNPDAAVRVGLSSLSTFDRIATQASCSGSEGFDICASDSLPLHSSSLKRHWWWWQLVNLYRRPVHSPLTVNDSLRDSDHVVDGFFVPPDKVVLTSQH